jgi:hypothetical protein
MKKILLIVLTGITVCGYSQTWAAGTGTIIIH